MLRWGSVCGRLIKILQLLIRLYYFFFLLLWKIQLKFLFFPNEIFNLGKANFSITKPKFEIIVRSCFTMLRIFLLACLSRVINAENCGAAITANRLVCGTNDGTATSQTVSFDPRSRSNEANDPIQNIHSKLFVILHVLLFILSLGKLWCLFFKLCCRCRWIRSLC